MFSEAVDLNSNNVFLKGINLDAYSSIIWPYYFAFNCLMRVVFLSRGIVSAIQVQEEHRLCFSVLCSMLIHQNGASSCDPYCKFKIDLYFIVYLFIMTNLLPNLKACSVSLYERITLSCVNNFFSFDVSRNLITCLLYLLELFSKMQYGIGKQSHLTYQPL